MDANKTRLLKMAGGWMFGVLLGMGSAGPGWADPFAEHIRRTDPLTPEQQLKTFHLPPGFEIQLVASEPRIGKPMNMAFDTRGRLWLTESVEYPFAAPLDQPGRDAIKILEDTTGDGRADRITTFADGLNIPIGLHPFGNGAIAWSIPHIWHFQDETGDGRADRRRPLYGPLGWERDTHGMNASFRRGFDGWLYITHGFNNESVVRGADGSEIRMQSGNTYRVRLDGSRVEPFTWGQVNPFGLCFDPLGNLYSADCHSSPIYQLLRGGFYPSFGKPHDGLGFAPEMMKHSHGSTAISGIAYYADDQWPEEYRDNIFIGNVMTSRVNRDVLVWHGSTPEAVELPDFVRCDDPWFRPVDLQFGPDGALYIADFYNRIIGHYEVPLDHPGRDRERGRIWRVVYRGADGERAQTGGERERFDLSRASVEELLETLGHPNFTRRLLATDELSDRAGLEAAAPIKRAWAAEANAFQKIHGLWVLHRLGRLDEETLAAASRDSDRGVRTHAMRVLAETDVWTASHRELALNGLRDVEPLARRAAADALGRHPAVEQIGPLLALRHQVPARDTHLLHVVRMALRNQLQPEGRFAGRGQAARAPFRAWPLIGADLSVEDKRAIADVALGIATPEAGLFLLEHVQTVEEELGRLADYLRHAARFVPEGKSEELARFSRLRFENDPDLQLALFQSVRQGAAQRGGPAGALREWGADLAGRLLDSAGDGGGWVSLPFEGKPHTTIPWAWEKRNSSDGVRGHLFLSSLPRGEQLTSVLRSRTFEIPARFSFFLAGQSGFPGRTDPMRNYFRLRAAGTGEVLAEEPVPRNDVAQRHSWDLAKHAGREGYFEVVDGDDGAAYAWIAFGRFDPPVVPMPELDPNRVRQRRQAALEIVQAYQLSELEGRILPLLEGGMADAETRAAAARALAGFNPGAVLAYGQRLVQEGGQPEWERMGRVLAEMSLPEARALLVEMLGAAPYRQQLQLAQALAGNREGAETLLKVIQEGKASAQLLLERPIRDRLRAARPSDLTERVETLTRGLIPLDEKVQRQIEQHRQSFSLGAASAERGAEVYTRNCAMCHQAGGEGAVVGPQLDGIGRRGLDRLLEDILDPNRNVDRAFRTQVLTLTNGEIVSGLFRREEGELMVLADMTGREISVAKSEIEEQRESETSLMPDNYGDAMPAEDLRDLLAFLLSL